MLYENWQVHVPLIYIRNRGSKDKWSLVGADVHDRLEVRNDGRELVYVNMQSCDSTEYGYEFHGEPIEVDEYGGYEYYIKMVPWTEAIKIYKKHDKSYRRFFRLMKNAAKKVIKRSKKAVKKDPPRIRELLEEARDIITKED